MYQLNTEIILKLTGYPSIWADQFNQIISLVTDQHKTKQNKKTHNNNM